MTGSQASRGNNSSSRKCLFCSTPNILRSSSSEEKEVVIKIENDGDSQTSNLETALTYSRLPAFKSNAGIEDDLTCFFVVTKILDIPKEKCVAYLTSEKEEYPSPGSWFGLCSKCYDGVRECFDIYKQMISLEQKVVKMKDKFKGLIWDSATKPRRKSMPIRGMNYIDDDIRCAVITEQEAKDETKKEKQKASNCVLNTTNKKRPRGSRRMPKRNKNMLKVKSKQKTASTETHGSGYEDNINLDDIIDNLNILNEIPALSPSSLPIKLEYDSLHSPLPDIEMKPSTSSNAAAPPATSFDDCERKAEGSAGSSGCSPSPRTLRTRKQKEGEQNEPEVSAKEHDQNFSEINDIDDNTSIASFWSHNDDSEDSDWTPNQINTVGSLLPSSKASVGLCSDVKPQTCSIENSAATTYDGENENANLADIGTRKLLKSPMLGTTDKKGRHVTTTEIYDLEELRNSSAISKTKILRIEYRHTCDVCPAVFSSIQKLKNHQELHTTNSGVKCQECGWLCLASTLNFHIGKRHPHLRKNKPKQKVKPRNKKQNSVPRNSDRNVVVLYRKNIPFYCDYCPMILMNRNLLKRHVLSAHTEILLVKCEACEEQFFTKQLLAIHTKTKHAELASQNEKTSTVTKDLGSYTCPHCSEIFQSQMAMDYHISRKHMDILGKCHICSFKVKKYYRLKQHLRTKHNIKMNKDVVCEICGLKFQDKGGLRYHKIQIHYKELGVTPFQCPHCESTFANKFNMDSHIAFVHEKVRNEVCQYCGKAFARTTELKRHILLHTAPREEQYKKGPFYCEFCEGVKFNVRQGLYYHLKKHHSDKYIYRCSKCAKGYAMKPSLSQHEKTCKGKN